MITHIIKKCCKACEGYGYLVDMWGYVQKCDICYGLGYIEKEEQISIVKAKKGNPGGVNIGE